MSVMVYPCILCVALLMSLFVLCVVCCVFDSVCELYGETIFFLGRFFIRNRQNYIQKMRMEDKMNTVIAREKKKIREQDGSTLVYIYIYIYIYIHTHI